MKSEKTKVSSKFVDVTANEKLVNLMSDFDVMLSCVEPFYKFVLPVVKAAIQARVNLVDICDDYDSTSKVLELDSAAKDAGITIISGLGVSPGATNILAKAARAIFFMACGVAPTTSSIEGFPVLSENLS